jgi:glycerate dehydrogenase
MKIVILDGYTTNPGDLSWESLQKFGQLEVYDWTDEKDVVPRLKGAKAAFTNKVRIGAEQMDALPDLKYIGIIATGLDCVDLNAAKERGIVVTNVPTYANYSVAQLVFALTLELCYRIDLHTRCITEDLYWSKQPYNSFWLKPLIGLNGKTLGIIGMGKIGERVAEIGKAFGMKVIAYDVVHREIPGVTWVELEELYKTSDVVTIHCPLLESTRGMINKKTLAMMKPTAFFINTSRGPLMVDQDVADALNNDVIAGAGLDVLGTEPPAPDNPLLKAKNVIITPHIGWATLDSRKSLIDTAAQNYEAFLKGESLNVVNK